MTGDGAVVRLWTERDIGTHEMFVVEHNGAIRHLVENANDKARTIAEQAVEIERLNDKLIEWQKEWYGWRSRLEDSKARAAGLLKALEGLLSPDKMSVYGTMDKIDAAWAAIAAAKGGTV